MHAPSPPSSALGAEFAFLTQHLHAEDRAALGAALVPTEVGEGERVVAQGQPSDRLWLVARGRFVVEIDAGGVPVEVGRKEPGDWFGEMGLVSPAPATATVTALEAGHLLSLDHAAYARIRQEHPALAGALLTAICCDLARRLRRFGQVRVASSEGRLEALPRLQALHGLERTPIACDWIPVGSARHRVRTHDPRALLASIERVGAFRPPTPQDADYVAGLRRDVECLARAMELETFLDGETVIQGGSRTDGLYVILAGGLRVTTPPVSGELHLDRRMAPGDLVGLVSFFDAGTRAATCTAEGATVLGVLYAASVQEILRQGVRGAPLGVHLLDWFARQLASDVRELNGRIATSVRGDGSAR